MRCVNVINATAFPLCGGSPGSLGVARDDESISISFLYIKIKFCAEQNFRNYYLLSIHFIPLPIISTDARNERSGEIQALAAHLLLICLFAAVRLDSSTSSE